MNQSVAIMIAGVLFFTAALVSLFLAYISCKKYLISKSFRSKGWFFSFVNLTVSLLIIALYLIFDYPTILVVSFACLFSWATTSLWTLFIGRRIPVFEQKLILYIISLFPLIFIPVYLNTQLLGIFDLSSSIYMQVLFLAAGSTTFLFLAWFIGYIKSRLDEFFQFAAISILPIVISVWLILISQAVSAFLISAVLFIIGLLSLAYTWVNYGQKTD